MTQSSASILPVEITGRWPKEKAWEWYNRQPWPCGFNYVPANAISSTEMWMDYRFDPTLIDRELALAQGVGFNCARVFLPFVVWEAEPESFKQRLEKFLQICHRRGIRVMLVLLDDCAFGPITVPVFGRQPEVIPGWFMNGWMPSPGHGMVRDPQTWPRIEKYVKDIIETFKDDPRVWVWDLYYEPTNCDHGDLSLPLLEKAFQWAREIAPSQALTAGEWNDNAKLKEMTYRLDDIITFHGYTRSDILGNHILEIKRQGRPVICTEWLNRIWGSTVVDCLTIFKREGVGAMHWGWVNGKMQTDLSTGHRPGDPDPVVWQHDLFRSDFTPYDPKEIALFKATLA